MKKATTLLTLLSAALLAGAHPAAAQGASTPAGRLFLNLSAGAQPQQRELANSETLTIYDEPAVITSVQGIDNGPMFDVTAGYRIRDQFAVAVGVSYFSVDSDAAVVASIPDPVFTDRPRTATGIAESLGHSELGVHLQAVWFVPVSDRIDVAFSAGPSIFRVSQETPSVTVPARTQNIDIVKNKQDATAIGLNAGVDGAFMLTPQVGIGLFVRYAGASVDLETAENLSVGGFQTGLGLRFRF